MPPVSAILFDFVGVLFVSGARYAADPLVEAVDRRIGQVVDDEAFRRETMRDHGLDDSAFTLLLERIAGRYQPFDPLWKLLPALRRSYRLGVINNGTYLTYPLFNARYHLGSAFDLFLSSARAGVRKPDPRIFYLACEQLKVAPVECLFMDDSSLNTAAAQSLGMQVICWDTPEEGFRQFNGWLAANTQDSGG